MARRKLANGKWSEILEPVELPAHPPGPIVRSSMPVELEELPVTNDAHAPTTSSNGVQHSIQVRRVDPDAMDVPAPLGEPTARQAAAWQAVARLGSQIAAARELGMSQGGIQTALAGYMAKMAINGPLPGKLPANERHGIRVAAAEKIRAEAAAPELQIEHPAQAELHPEPVVATEPPDSFEPFPQMAGALHPWLEGAIVWLAEHGPTWNQGQAEKWLVAFTRILDLVYPPGA